MANSKVALLRYVRIARGWRRFRVHAIRRGRGWDERISPPEGAEILERGEFQLRWYRGADAVYKGVGHDLQEAITARDNQMANLEAERAALAAGRKLVSDGPGRVVPDGGQRPSLGKDEYPCSDAVWGESAVLALVPSSITESGRRHATRYFPPSGPGGDRGLCR
jgi:hypothetical protein